MSEEEVTSVPLLTPSAGTPDVIDTESAFVKALAELASGSGPFAVDAERASGFRYSARAYLIQIKRTGGGLHLIDPIPFGPGHKLFAQLNELLNTDEVILHASTQDLPCLRELGIHPVKLFDTELGGRIAGLPRVGLGPLLESQMGVSLAKEHSAADWSVRPLPVAWLTYAALDVELLVELRNKMYELLKSSGKLEWAMQEFNSILAAPPSPPRVDPWRRTSGMHKIKRRDHLATIKELWITRDSIAQKEDIAAGKLLNDYAIVELAMSVPKNKKEFEKSLRPLGLRARWLENIDTWLTVILESATIPEDQWPPLRSHSDNSMPPVKLWRDRFPDKYAPLTHARAAIESRAQELSIPLENLITPDYIRRLCWEPPQGATEILSEGAVREKLVSLGARPWQIDIVAPLIAPALLEKEALPEPKTEEEPASEESPA
jgi:ribonuclease D